MFKDYYRILGIDPRSSAEAVRSAFKAKALLYHPDRRSAPSDAASAIPDAADQSRTLGPSKDSGADGFLASSAAFDAIDFRDVQESYEVLSDVARRYLYDLNYAEAAKYHAKLREEFVAMKMEEARLQREKALLAEAERRQQLRHVSLPDSIITATSSFDQTEAVTSVCDSSSSKVTANNVTSLPQRPANMTAQGSACVTSQQASPPPCSALPLQRTPHGFSRRKVSSSIGALSEVSGSDRTQLPDTSRRTRDRSRRARYEKATTAGCPPTRSVNSNGEIRHSLPPLGGGTHVSMEFNLAGVSVRRPTVSTASNSKLGSSSSCPEEEGSTDHAYSKAVRRTLEVFFAPELLAFHNSVKDHV